jgi:glycosyltransferase involved in cell wall biosynthesis
MKIILLHYSVPPVVGGVESVLGHQARLMADDGHHVYVIAGRGEQFDPRVEFIHLPLVDSRHPDILSIKKELDDGRIPTKFAGLVDVLVGMLAQAISDADVIIVHNVCSLNKNLALTAALSEIAQHRQKPRLILWHHDLAWTTPRYQSELHAGYPWDLLRTAWPGAIQVVASELRRTELAGLFGIPADQINLIPNGLDVAQFLKLENKTVEFVKRLHLLEAVPLLLLPVRITPRKNIELALRTLAVLRMKFQQAKLIITGPLGPHNPANAGYFEQLLALRRELDLNQAACFLAELSSEYLPDNIIADFYRLADALFLPSQEEGFGIPILEAGLAGLPVFCTDIPPLRQLGGDQAAYFSHNANPAEVAALITDCLAADATFGLRVRVRQHYTWERVYAEKIAPLLHL